MRLPPAEKFVTIGKNVRSRFFTMDLAKRRNGDWLIVELDDGQVAGLPKNADVDDWPAPEPAELQGSL